MDLVSIVIPTYKGSDVISRAVDSVLRQNYEPIEIIVVDDNGLDSYDQRATAYVMEQYKNDARVRYIPHEKSSNGSVARNTGMRAACGAVIALLDDDDEFIENKISKQMEIINKLPENWGMVYCSCCMAFENGRRQIIDSTYSGEILADFFAGRIEIGSSQIMIRSAVMKSVGYFDETFRRHQDWEYIARIAQKYKVAVAREPLVIKYVLKRNSPKKASDYRDNRIYYLEKMKAIIKAVEPTKQKLIYDFHYKCIAIAFLKERNFLEMTVWIGRAAHPMRTLWNILADARAYVVKGLHR